MDIILDNFLILVAATKALLIMSSGQLSFTATIKGLIFFSCKTQHIFINSLHVSGIVNLFSANIFLL